MTPRAVHGAPPVRGTVLQQGGEGKKNESQVRASKWRQFAIQSPHKMWYACMEFTLARAGMGSRWPRSPKTWPDVGPTQLGSAVANNEIRALCKEFSGQRSSGRSGIKRLRPGPFSTTKARSISSARPCAKLFCTTPHAISAHILPRGGVEKGSRITGGWCGRISVREPSIREKGLSVHRPTGGPFYLRFARPRTP
jgi:hypothetical protein